MKKIIPTLLFSCFFVSTSFSQISMTMGIRAGVNLATYKFNFGPNLPAGFVNPISNVPLLTVGIPLEVSFSNHFAVQTEFNFIQKGFSSKFETTFQTTTIKSEGTLHVNWLEIPILAKAKFGSTDGISGGLFFGPSIALGLSGKSKSTSVTTTNNVSTTTSNSEVLDFKNDEHSRVDVGLNLGGQLNYSGLFLDVRYQLGLTDMTSGKITSVNSSESAKTRGFALTVGYRFPIGIGTVTELKTKKK
jgi:hypothetical protein